MRRYREERNQAQSAKKALQEQINTLQVTVQELNDQLESKNEPHLTRVESGGEDRRGEEASGVGTTSGQIKSQDTAEKPAKQLCVTSGCSSKAVPELGGLCPECYEDISMYN